MSFQTEGDPMTSRAPLPRSDSACHTSLWGDFCGICHGVVHMSMTCYGVVGRFGAAAATSTRSSRGLSARGVQRRGAPRVAPSLSWHTSWRRATLCRPRGTRAFAVGRGPTSVGPTPTVGGAAAAAAGAGRGSTLRIHAKTRTETRNRPFLACMPGSS